MRLLLQLSINLLNENTRGCAANDGKHQDDSDDDSDDIWTGDSRQVFPPLTGENIVKGTSCRDILRQNRYVCVRSTDSSAIQWNLDLTNLYLTKTSI